MKILLVNSYFLANDPNEQRIMKPYPPLGILYLSSTLKQAGHETAVFDGTFSAPNELQGELETFAPDLVGIYANVITREAALDLLATTRRLGFPAILGGPDATGDGDAYLEAGALAVVLGEGERTVIELVDHLESQGFDADLSGIAGLRFVTSSGIVDTGRRERLSDLDSVPFPDREAIDMQMYLTAWRDRHGQTSVNLISTRGCPYSCTWCSREVFGDTAKQRSPGNVIEELDFLTSTYRPDQIWFSDDVLTLNKAWLLELTEQMRERDLTTPFECLSRVDRVDEEVLDALKGAGCYRIWYGAESGSQKMVEAMRKGFTVEQVRTTVKLTMQKGIEAGLFILIGYPGEGLADFARTLTFIRRLRPHYCGASVAFPIKGTPFYDQVSHLLADDYAWSRRNENRLSFRGRFPRLFYWFAIRLMNNWSTLYSAPSRRVPLFTKAVSAAKVLIAAPCAFVIGWSSGLWRKFTAERT